ncbi:hypothetical protein FS749_009643 [Ceratobasidium sp. UAMH 11750]|nr:hypothetical protein FS749_009643 [Ceratobasidium sp. UAMH 11750]
MVVVPPSASSKQKSSKKAKQKEKTDSDVHATSEPRDKKRKKHRGEGDDVRPAATPVIAGHEPPKKKQKVERKDVNEDNDVADNTRIESSPSKPEREKRPKKPKDKTPVKASTEEAPVSVLDKIRIADIPIPYTNPLTDASLPELSQRGLAYAYQYAQHISLPSDSARAAQQPWKFNKGRQNWIIRNVTDPAVVPDQYLALAMVYIDSIKGGARDVLKKTCKTTTKETKAAAVSQPEPDQKPSDEPAEPESEPTSKKVAFATETTEPTTSTPITKERRKRAKKILKVLRGKIQPQDI